MLATLALPGVSQATVGATYTVPAIGTPTVDGSVGFSEWGNAVAYPVRFDNGGTPLKANVLLGRDATNLYVAVVVREPTVSNPAQTTPDWLQLTFDKDGDDVADDRWLSNFGGSSDYYVFSGSSHPDTTNEVSSARAFDPGSKTRTYEFSHPLCTGSAQDICFSGTAQVGVNIGYESLASNTSYHPSSSSFAGLRLATLGGEPQGGTLLMVNAADDHDDGACTVADCTLREAIARSNSTVGSRETIGFGLQGGTGVRTIGLKSSLPAITDAVFIDGTIQARSSVNSAAVGTNAQILVELRAMPLFSGDDTIAGAALGITGAGSVVQSLVINGEFLYGIDIRGAGAASNTLSGNFIGTDPTGTSAPFPIAQYGVNISGGAHDNVVGGTLTGTRNLISGTHNTSSGAAAIDISNAGVFSGAPTRANVIRGNLLGTKADGASALGNDTGIYLQVGTTDNQIAENVIGFSRRNGVSLLTAGDVRNRIWANSIHSNAGLGIDLGGDGVTPNDAPTARDGDTGANGLQNFPVVTSASVSGTGTTIGGELYSAGSAVFTLDFYVDSVCDPTGYGEGARPLTSTAVSTNTDGYASFSVSTFSASGYITATATAEDGSTSEFSACRLIAGGGTGGLTTTTTSATPSASAVDVGSPVTAAATVTGGTPTGTVGFSVCGPLLTAAGCVSGTAVGAAKSLASGGATSDAFSPSAQGWWCFRADYGGDSAHSPSSDGDSGGCFVANHPAILAPTTIQAVPGASGTKVVGRLREQPSTSYTLSFYNAASCALLTTGSTLLGTHRLTTDPAGEAFFDTTVPGIGAVGSFVAATVTDGRGKSGLSNCVAAGPDNDQWPRALGIAASSQVSQYLDQDGQSRWYRFDVTPNSRVTVDLDGLPANYDLFVFKDIGAAFTNLTTTQDLVKLSAEFAGDATAPSAFSPSAFSPSAFSPSAFSPSAFSPSAFSPSAFSPSAFSPSAFSPSAFSPSAFSPSAFSPSAFSPSAFSPDAYASAQVRSLIGGSANEGTAAEHITFNTWNNTAFYLRVNGRNGVSSLVAPFRLNVATDSGVCGGITPIGSAPAPVSTTGIKTVILTDPSRMAGTSTEKAAMTTRLQTLASRAEVGGAIVDLAQNARVAQLNVQADARPACPYAKNLVAEAMKDVVDSYRAANPGLKYVVAVGNDHAVPFFRYPDQAGLGAESSYVPPVLDSSASQASLRLDYVLSQDSYGAKTAISLKDDEFPVVDLAVGRLIETPAEVTTMLDAYLNGTAGGTVPTPTSSLVTGYDFLTDAAQAVQSHVEAGLGTGANVRKDSLITDSAVPPSTVGDPPNGSWDADRLRAKLLGTRHDLIFLAGHFSANNLLAADYATTINSTELATSPVNLTNAIVWSAGCHSGYNIVDQDAVVGVTSTLDWTEAFAQKGATLIAGTGYQYGDTDFLEYGERLYAGFARELRRDSGPVSVGDALLRAKQDYLATTPMLRGIHQKSLLESTLFGLPMLSVDLPSGRIPVPASSSVVTSTSTFTTNPGQTLGLRSADISVTDTLTAQTKSLNGGAVIASYLSGPDGVVTYPGEPALPFVRKDVSAPNPGYVLRGVGFRGGTFTDRSGVTPLTGAATTELGAVHGPFLSPVFFPARVWSVNYFDALTTSGGRTSLLLTPAQYRWDGGSTITDTERRYTGLDLRLYYSDVLRSFGSNSPALAAPPSIIQVESEADATAQTVTFGASVVGDPSAGIQQVWVTFFGKTPGAWESLDLTQSAADSTRWTGTLAGVTAPGDLRYVVQAANGVGLVSLDDAFGAYHRPAGQQVASPASTGLALSSPPATGPNGSLAQVRARLTSNGVGLGGKLVSFSIGGSSALAFTDATGEATANVPLTALPGAYVLSASFAGDIGHTGTTISAPFTIGRQQAALALSPTSSTLSVSDPGPVAALTGGGRALAEQTVLFVLTRRSDGAVTRFARITDLQGSARLGVVDVPAGVYALDVLFGGTHGPVALGDPKPYTVASAAGTLEVKFAFAGLFQPVENTPNLNKAKAGSAIPIKFKLGYDAGLSIFASNFPKVSQIPCAAASGDTIEETVSATSNSLNYDALSNTYTYVWKTSSTFENTCRELRLRFVNGADRVALFKFVK